MLTQLLTYKSLWYNQLEQNLSKKLWEWELKVFHHLGKILKANGDSTNVGNEGGYAPSKIQGTEGALNLICEAVKAAGYELGKDITFALDAASSEFCKEVDGKYEYHLKEKVELKTLMLWLNGMKN